MTMEMINHAIHTLSWYVYTRYIMKGDLSNTLTDRWVAEIDRTKLEIPYPILLRRDDAGDDIEIIFQGRDDTIGFLIVGTDMITLNLATTKDDLKSYITEFKELLVPIPETDEGKINVKFWYHAPNGPTAVTRIIQAPSWGEIEENYVPDTKDKLTRLMHNFKPSHGGQLILWHGDPGGGKTYALRALCAAWKKWCSIDYIVDPEAFFGGSPSYLMQIISSQHEGEDIEWDDDDNPIVYADRKQSKWKLLILEDSGDFLALNAREKTGQALSRLLNVADGFIGQGLKVILLITTNEELGKLHPAVSRPGRSAAITQFDRFSHKDASVWAAKHGLVLPPGTETYSLAEMYSLLNGYLNHAENNKNIKRKEFGFGSIQSSARLT